MFSKKLSLMINSLLAYVLLSILAAQKWLSFRFRYQHNETQDELLMVDMADGQTEIKPVEQLSFYQISETVVGWVVLVRQEDLLQQNGSNIHTILCSKMFPESKENQVLFTLTPEQVDKVALTYDSLMYIECSNNLCKVVSRDLLSGNSVEMAFAQWNPNMAIPDPFLIAASDRSYLIRPSEDQENRVYKVQQDHLGITLTYLNQVDDQFMQLIQLAQFSVCKAVNDKIAGIHPLCDDPKLLTFVHLAVPSLKSLAVWAVQKLYGTIGDDGELVDGISEEELKKSIGLQQDKKLF